MWLFRKQFTTWSALIAIASSQFLSSAYGAYDQVVTWSDMSSIDLKPAFESPYASETNLLYPTLNPSSYDIVLRDADQRINPEFHVPAELEKPFHFWRDIYTKYTTQQMVFFDRVNPDVVYEILDFRELSQKHPNRIIYELTMKHWITKKIKAYKAAFASLSKKHQKRHKMTEEEKNILSALERSKHQHLKVAALAKTFHSQLGQRDNMVKGLLAAESYFPMMEQLFMSEGIPPELTRLSMVESSFDLSAYSRVGAVGIWQFMPGPGHKLLTIDDQAGIDERVSPLKSTVAAGRLLHFNYKLFHNWALAITSYNPNSERNPLAMICGRSRIFSIPRRRNPRSALRAKTITSSF
jgi:predicted transcriptional regulator